MSSNDTGPGEPFAPMQKLVVTGSSGFIGRQFCASFGGSSFSDVDGDVDLRDAARVHAAVAALQPEAVLHLAAQSSVKLSFDDPVTTYEVNFTGTLHLLQALQASGFKGVLLMASSADIYGNVPEEDLPIRECRPALPRSPYAVSKVAAEALCYQWAQVSQFRIVMVRPFSQIGPGHGATFAIPNFARQIVEMKQGLRAPALHTGNLDVVRDFTDVRDTVRALHLLLQNGVNGEAYNICSGQGRTMRSLVEDMLRLAGVQAEMSVDPDRLRPVEQQRMIGDNGKIREHAGWVPEMPMQTTLNDVLKDAERQHHV